MKRSRKGREMEKKQQKEQEDKKKAKELGGHKGHGYYMHYCKAKVRRKRLNPFSTCIAGCTTHDYLCLQQSRMKSKIMLEIYFIVLCRDLSAEQRK